MNAQATLTEFYFLLLFQYAVKGILKAFYALWGLINK